MGTAPVAAVALAFRVSTLAAVPLAAKLALTPSGRPLALNVTLPEKPFAGVIVIVSLALLPWTTLRLLACAARLKSGAGGGLLSCTVIMPAMPTPPGAPWISQ